jgi:Pyruvate/2-oxoacid:ferredoxin oxidoreductase delta subunit
VAQAHLDVAQKLSSPLLMGPPLCDELVAFVQHVFTEEEAGVVRHLGPVLGMTAEDLARAEHRPVEQILPLLDQLGRVKRAIAASGPAGKEKFRLLPIMPGIFEMVLISESPDSLSPWHRRFAELVEALYQTGYYGDYVASGRTAGPFARVLTVGQTIDAPPMALPSDRLEVVLDRYQVFGVGQCQCRTTQLATGRGCSRPVRVCTVVGQWATQGIKEGWLTQVSKKEVLEIKRDAESHGLVTWMMNVESTKGQASCSCCPCCCYALRLMNDFNAPALLAPAHFLPQFDEAKCTFCGRCVNQCPTRALAIDAQQKTRVYQRERCVGCGLCAVACGDRKAIAMEPVPDYKLPYRSWFSMIASSTPRMLKRAWDVWRKR